MAGANESPSEVLIREFDKFYIQWIEKIRKEIKSRFDLNQRLDDLGRELRQMREGRIWINGGEQDKNENVSSYKRLMIIDKEEIIGFITKYVDKDKLGTNEDKLGTNERPMDSHQWTVIRGRIKDQYSPVIFIDRRPENDWTRIVFANGIILNFIGTMELREH